MSAPILNTEGARWGWSALGSVGLHGAAIGAGFLGVALGHPPQPPPPAAMVVEVSLLNASPPIPPRDTPPGPEQKETRPTPVKQPAKLPDIPEFTLPVQDAVVVPIKQEIVEEKPDDQKRVDVSTAPTSTPSPPDKEASAPTVGRSAAPPSNAEQAWEGLVLAQLERNKRYPAAAQRNGMQDVVMVGLTLDRHGKVLDAKVRRSRGYAILDAEVLALVRRASPLPAPPEEITEDPVVLTVPVEFFMKKNGR